MLACHLVLRFSTSLFLWFHYYNLFTEKNFEQMKGITNMHLSLYRIHSIPRDFTVSNSKNDNFGACKTAAESKMSDLFIIEFPF